MFLARFINLRLTKNYFINKTPFAGVNYKTGCSIASGSASTTTMDDYVTVTYVTAPTEDVARKLAKKLVENRFAACVNIVKTIESIYEWKGQVEKDNESMLIIKSLSSKTAALTEFVESNHPYECPEVITVKLDSGSRKYIDWLKETIEKPRISTEDKPKELQPKQ